MNKSSSPALRKLKSLGFWLPLASLICFVVFLAADSTLLRTSAAHEQVGTQPKLAGVFASLPSTAAATINVNSTAPSPGASGDCTLGEAIQAANTNAAVDGCGAGSDTGADTIMLPAGTYTLSNAVSAGGFGDAGLPGITTDVIIQGASAATTIIERSASAATQFRLMVVANQSGGSLVLNDLTMRGGRSNNEGGALYTAGRPATLNRVVFDDNRSVTYAGAVATSSQGGALVANDCTFTNNQTNGQGGAIVASPATISNSTFTGNSAFYGGALYYVQGSLANFNIADSTFTNNHAAAGGGIGGAIYFSGSATIHRSRFESNSAGSTNSNGGAIAGVGTLNLFDSVLNDNDANYGGGLHLSNCNFNITRTTISNNQALTHFGGGIYVNAGGGNISASTINGNSATLDGGGLWISNIELTLTNVTIDGNTSSHYGGGIYFQTFSPKTLAVNNVTVTGNVAASQGGGIFRYDYDGTISARNSIIALNTSSINTAPNIYAPTAGTFTSLGYNLIGIKDGANFTNAVGDQTGTTASPVDPLLGPLQDNDGPTFTRGLLTGSTAIDAGNPATPGSGGTSCEANDQRGIIRPQSGGGVAVSRCDKGALERWGGEFQLSSATYIVNEGAGSLEVTVKRTSRDFTVSVSYSTSDGTAIAGSDYTATSGTLTFSDPTLTEQTFNIPINDDGDDEPNETFNIVLSNPTDSAVLIAPNTAVATIKDNDLPLMTIDDVTINEGNSGNTTATFHVSFGAPQDELVKVNYATANGTASSANDYQAKSGGFIFVPGETSKTLEILIQGDDIYELDETFFINLTSPSNAIIVDSQGLGTITNDDFDPQIGNYPNTAILLGANATVTPFSAPYGLTSLNVGTDTRFKGLMVVDPATGVVRITNAHPAGTYTVTLRGFYSGGMLSKSFTLTVGSGPASLAQFVDGADVDVGNSSDVIAVGDFNNDNKQDLAVSHRGATPDLNRVSIRMGDGNGVFAGSTDVGVGSQPSALVIADLNNDGNQDFATANSGADTVSIRLGDGSGGFSGTEFLVGSNPLMLLTGDLNRDGHQDLVVNVGSTLGIRLGDGTGSFDTQTGSIPLANLFSFALGDFNNDAVPDLICTNADKIFIYRGNGSGGFLPPTQLNISGIMSLVLGDFNNDGNQDFVAVDHQQSLVSVRLGNGLGGFSESATVAVNPASLAVGDFNNDGNQDLALTVGEVNAQSRIDMHLGDGSGQFSDVIELDLGIESTSIPILPFGLAIGDFNGDTKQDFAYASNVSSTILSIFLGVERPQLCAPLPVGLVSWYSGDRNALDPRSRNNGTEFGGLSYTVGKVRRAFTFGDGTEPAYVEIPHSPTLDLTDAGTLGFWIYLPTDSHSGPIISKGTFENATQSYAVEADAVGHIGKWLRFVLAEGPGSVLRSEISTPLSELVGGWNHLVYSWDGEHLRLYKNGVFQEEVEYFFVRRSTPEPVILGNRNTSEYVPGKLDEVQFYNRALTGAEITTLYNAQESILGGTASGNCKPTATNAPNGQVAWWPGDGGTNDIAGTNHGTFQDGGGFTVGKVGQSFLFESHNGEGGVNFMRVPDAPPLNPAEFTIESWVFPTANISNGGQNDVGSIILTKGAEQHTQYAIAQRKEILCGNGDDGSKFGNLIFKLDDLVGLPNDCAGYVDGNAFLPLKAWSHVALNYDGLNVRVFVNGILKRTLPAQRGGSGWVGDSTLYIGGSPFGIETGWPGKIDETSIYNRALTTEEIQSIYNAGLAGKIKTATTPTGSNVTTDTGGGATVTIANVSKEGTTQQYPVPPYALPPTLPGYSLIGLNYELGTSAKGSGPIQTCFNVASVTASSTFSKLRLLHVESDSFVDRTTTADFGTKTLCGTVSSFSPFAIAQNTNTPTAAPGSISGQITTANGAALSGVTVTLTGDSQPRQAITNQNGEYVFADVETERFYVVTPTLANYLFTPAEHSFALLDNKTDATFTATAVQPDGGNRLDSDEFFVRQHYLDFLGREPDSAGLAFWTNQITQCETRPQSERQSCREVRRINVSAAFFLSIEYQETGFFAARVHRTAFRRRSNDAARRVSYQQLSSDTRVLGEGVVVGHAGWEQKLEANKQNYLEQLVNSSDFLARFPASQNATQFVDALFSSAGVTPTSTERQDAVAVFGAGETAGRAAALRKVAESASLIQAEFNPAFVLMQYHGYLRRNPTDPPDTDDSGYQFWLTKLNQFGGNYINAEMVKAFINAGEYRRRFDP